MPENIIKKFLLICLLFEILAVFFASIFLKIKSMIIKMIGRYEIISMHNNFFSKISTLAKNHYLPHIFYMKIIFYKFLYQIFSTDKLKYKITKIEKNIFYIFKKK